MTFCLRIISQSFDTSTPSRILVLLFIARIFSILLFPLGSLDQLITITYRFVITTTAIVTSRYILPEAGSTRLQAAQTFHSSLRLSHPTKSHSLAPPTLDPPPFYAPHLTTSRAPTMLLFGPMHTSDATGIRCRSDIATLCDSAIKSNRVHERDEKVIQA